MIAGESNRYTKEVINPNFTDTITILELCKFIGILIHSSVDHYPNVPIYWGRVSNIGPAKVRFAPIADN